MTLRVCHACTSNLETAAEFFKDCRELDEDILISFKEKLSPCEKKTNKEGIRRVFESLKNPFPDPIF